MTILAVLLISSCDPISVEKQLLDASWKFQYDPDSVGLREGWFKADLDRRGWQDLAVPGEWPDNDYDGFAWYATEIQAPNYPSGYGLALVFESVDDNAVIWLDGRLAGKHNGYGEQFYIDMDDKLDDGKKHSLVVRIEDLALGGGINKPVFLMPYLEENDLIRTEASKQTAPAAPEWARSMSVYEIFIRSHSGARTFKAVQKDLDRIERLGIDLIWFMPVHPIGVKNHKGEIGSPYAVRDYFRVNPDFGTFEDFKDLVNDIHSRGMRVMLDMVLNHTSWDNALIEEHEDWYTHDEYGEIVSPNPDWWDTADLNYNSPELRKWMIEMLQYWLTEGNVDGFRFDVAELVPLEFWKDAKAACQQVKPDVFFLAEGAKPELHLNGHDMTYSWNMWKPMINVASGKTEVSALKRAYDKELLMYPRNALRMRFTENHDKRRSHADIEDDDLNVTAWAFIALMKGNPLIYAGQEVGAQENVDIHENPIIFWSRADREVEQKMGEILGLRKAWIKPDSEFDIFLADDDKRIIAFKHGEIVAFFNFSDKDFSFSARGMESILYGGLKKNQDGSLTLAAKKFGVFQ